jgi:hypothetical protein
MVGKQLPLQAQTCILSTYNNTIATTIRILFNMLACIDVCSHSPGQGQTLVPARGTGRDITDQKKPQIKGL